MEIKIKGMSCAHCTKAVTEALEEIGLKNIRVDLDTGIAKFDEDASITSQQINEAVEEAGYAVI